MNKQKRIVCLTPVFNDWESLNFLAKDIKELESKSENNRFFIYAINDGSSEKQTLDNNFCEEHKLEIINLKANVGHQRAIAIGIQYLNSKLKISEKEDLYVVVLDADGEDKVSDVIPMVKKADNNIVFAKRTQRSEGRKFKLGYTVYKLLFYILTGKKINYGNYSVIPFNLLNEVALLPKIWNHYASAISNSKIRHISHSTNRGTRYSGFSKMNTQSLIMHGLSAISIYFDTLCFRILKFSFFAFLICVLGIICVLYKKLFAETAIPGWASSLILISLSIITQLFSVTFIILLFQLRARKEVTPPNVNLFKEFIQYKND